MAQPRGSLRIGRSCKAELDANSVSKPVQVIFGRIDPARRVELVHKGGQRLTEAALSKRLVPRIENECGRREPERRANAPRALRVMMALSVELLLIAPMRMKNLTKLEIGRHLISIRRGAKQVWRMVLAPHETKTRSPYEAELPASAVALLNVYLERCRSLLVRQKSQFLFPGLTDASRNRSGFGRAISEFIERETGLEMHPHLFRHFAAKVHLDMHPQQIETVRMVLGHASTRTTLKAYAELSSDPAMRAYSATIDRLRSELDVVTAMSSTGKLKKESL